MTPRATTSKPRPEIAKAFLEPASVAVVGASASTGSTTYKAGGRAVLDHLARYGFGGEVIAVHRSATEIDGHRTVPSLRALSSAPDVVVIAVPAPTVREVLEDCAAIGARQALILTGGFGDMGAEGLALEADLLDFAGRNGIHVVGPNSTGLVTVRTGLAMSMTSVLTTGTPLRDGRLALVAQSGAIASAILERARDAGVGLSHLVSTGDQYDMDPADFIAWFAVDGCVDTVAVYLESIRDGARFTAAVRQLHGAGKRLLAYLGGRTAAGEKAAATHTGKIQGRGALELGMLQSLGVVVVDDPDDLWMLGGATVPEGGLPRDWGMVTYSGGMAVLAVEQLGQLGVRFPDFSPATVERMRPLSPTFATFPNPLDTGPGAMPLVFGDHLSAIADDEGVSVVCIPLPMGARGWNDHLVEHILRVRDATGKPFVVLWYGGRAANPYSERLREAGVLVLESPSALGRVVAPLLRPEDESAPKTVHGPELNGVTGGFEALATLADAGLDTVPMRLADGPGSAAFLAGELGYPVVVKSGAEDVTHRTELGLVAVGLRDEQEVRAAVERMSTRAPTHDRWLVQAMAAAGTELVLTVRDAGTLGVFAGIGVGGVAVELLRDMVQVPLPCDEPTLRDALRRLRASPLLFGYRGAEPIDVGWLTRTISGLAEVLSAEKLGEIELNPVIARARGGSIVDALFVREV